MSGARQGVVAALDVGTTKVSCFIAKSEGAGREPHRALRITGIGHQVSHGVKKGAVSDLEQVEDTIRAAVETAEKMAGTTLRQVVVNLSAGHPASHTINVGVTITGRPVSDEDLKRLLLHGCKNYQPEGRVIVHSIPAGYTIDDNHGIQDPRGMFGDRLSVRLHMVTAATAPIRNLARCVERCHLELAGLVVSPYASGLACLVEDEAELGAICVDMGGGTTSLSVFAGGQCVYADVVPIGGQHVTNDIARGLSTSIANAERMKTLYGSALASSTDDREMIDVQLMGEEDRESSNHIPRSLLTGIIQPRLEETFELVRDRLRDSGVDYVAGKRMVLTGGASQMTGARELGARILGKNVRLARPKRMKGLADAVGGPAFATCAGLLNYAMSSPAEAIITDSNRDGLEEHRTGQLSKISRWLKKNF